MATDSARPPDWFHGVRAVKTAAEGKTVDGVRAHQMILVRGESEQKLSPETRARRDELERQLSALRARKPAMNEDDYYKQLETIMVQTARLYENGAAEKVIVPFFDVRPSHHSFWRQSNRQAKRRRQRTGTRHTMYRLPSENVCPPREKR